MIGWKRTKRGVQILFKFKKKQEKDKTKLKKTLIYFGILLVFALGVISTALIIKFVDDTIRERLILLILFISIIVIIVLNFKIMKEKL